MRSAPGNSATLCRAHRAHQMFLPLERAALAGDPSRKHLSRQALRVATWKGCSAAGNSWVGCIFREFRVFFHPWLCLLFVLSLSAVVWQRLGYLSPVWHNLFSLPLPTTRGVHPKPSPTLAGEETTPFHKSRHWDVRGVCIMQCSEEPDSWGDKPAWPVLSRTFILPGMMSPPRNLSPWLESGITVCGDFLDQSYAQRHGKSAGIHCTQTTPAWKVGTHPCLHQKCLLEIIMLILFIFATSFPHCLVKGFLQVWNQMLLLKLMGMISKGLCCPELLSRHLVPYFYHF